MSENPQTNTMRAGEARPSPHAAPGGTGSQQGHGTAERPRIILADDHLMILDGLRAMLDDSYEVVECVTRGDALVQAVAAHAPDAVICDVAMPGGGFAAARTILERTPGMTVVMLTMNNNAELAADALRLGVRAYVLKTGAIAQLEHAIDTALAGRTHLSPEIAKEAEAALSRPPRFSRSPMAGLTSRQQEVLRLIAAGYTMKTIAQELRISPRTVAFHKYRIMEATGAKTNAELIRTVINADSEVG